MARPNRKPSKPAKATKNATDNLAATKRTLPKNATLTWKQVDALRRKAHARRTDPRKGASINELAREYGLSRNAVVAIVSGISYKDPGYNPEEFVGFKRAFV